VTPADSISTWRIVGYGIAKRADIRPFAWVLNQNLTPLDVTDPILRARRSQDAAYLRELGSHATRTALEPWPAHVVASEAVGA
jgi:hypothetical protein